MSGRAISRRLLLRGSHGHPTAASRALPPAQSRGDPFVGPPVGGSPQKRARDGINRRGASSFSITRGCHQGVALVRRIEYFGTMSETPPEPPVGTVHGVVPRCPICGNQGWVTARPTDLKPGEPFQEVVASVRSGVLLGLAVQVFICTNCGWVRQHLVGTYKP